MATINVIDRTIQCFQVSDDIVNLVEMVLMLCSINGTRHHFDVIQIFLDLVELMASVNLQHREVQVFQICNFSFHVHESVLVFHGVHRSSQIFQRLNLLLNLVELVLIVNNDGIVQLLDGIQTLENLGILVISVYLVNRIIQGLQVCEMLFNLCEIVSSLNRVYRTL